MNKPKDCDCKGRPLGTPQCPKCAADSDSLPACCSVDLVAALAEMNRHIEAQHEITARNGGWMSDGCAAKERQRIIDEIVRRSPNPKAES